MITQNPILYEALTATMKETNLQSRIHSLPQKKGHQRAILGDILIARDNNWKEETLKLIDQVWKDDTNARTVTRQGSLREISNYQGTNISIWKGDITTLQVDSIVNAANCAGLGCFIPSHKCIDNVIHRSAGPRLRKACREQMKKRDGFDLSAGSPPIITKGFHLPSKNVIHVTGPEIKSIVTLQDRENLSSAYRKSLDCAAANNLKSIAFPGISTGLFGFPKEEATEIALKTVQTWLDLNPRTLEKVVFNVFDQESEVLYYRKVGQYFPINVESMDLLAAKQEDAVTTARRWMENADAVFIVAGAGMSVKEGEMVYTNPQDFAHHYPWFPKWGYKTSYEVMGLFGDNRVPETAKWALHAKHMDNMRWKFTPNDGYKTLLEMVQQKDYFVLTSNVDACFERSGFDPQKIYTPQGEWTYLQCLGPCRQDSFFESREYIDKIRPHISSNGHIPEKLIPKCPNCGGHMFGNVRGGGWFLHHKKYEEQEDRLNEWMEEKMMNPNQNVVVIEIGAGFNTPVVTRFPAENFTRALGDRGHLIRINPSDSEVPNDLNQAVSLTKGWQVLGSIAGGKELK